MEFNSKKFELLRYGSDNQLKEATSYTSNSGDQIATKLVTKDLDVLMSSSGDFKDHIHQLIETVRDLLNWILRSFKSRSPTLMLQLWKSIVVPRLDYSSQLWNPNQIGLIQQTPAVFCQTHCWPTEQWLLHLVRGAWSLFSAKKKREIPNTLHLVNTGESHSKHPTIQTGHHTFPKPYPSSVFIFIKKWKISTRWACWCGEICKSQIQLTTL